MRLQLGGVCLPVQSGARVPGPMFCVRWRVLSPQSGFAFVSAAYPELSVAPKPRSIDFLLGSHTSGGVRSDCVSLKGEPRVLAFWVTGNACVVVLLHPVPRCLPLGNPPTPRGSGSAVWLQQMPDMPLVTEACSLGRKPGPQAALQPAQPQEFQDQREPGHTHPHKPRWWGWGCHSRWPMWWLFLPPQSPGLPATPLPALTTAVGSQSHLPALPFGPILDRGPGALQGGGLPCGSGVDVSVSGSGAPSFL